MFKSKECKNVKVNGSKCMLKEYVEDNYCKI